MGQRKFSIQSQHIKINHTFIGNEQLKMESSKYPLYLL
jgi:hypothetical protein